jgi:hypothetical protein
VEAWVMGEVRNAVVGGDGEFSSGL